MNDQYARILTEFPLFKGFTVHGAQMLIESGEMKQHAAGEIIFRAGDPATFTCLLFTGKLEVFVSRQGSEIVLREAAPGTVLGELAVLCGLPRSASVRAKEPSAVLHWSAEAFRRLLLRDAFLSERIIGQSLRNLIEKEQSLLEALAKAEGATK